jgi:HD-GYP domain-containing protein (c-di-GMP phosphodiesterase class II)
VNARVEALLRDMQNAVAARHLYPAEHPRIREALDRIAAEAESLTASAGEVSVFVVEDRLIHDGDVLPGGEPIARGLFQTLRLSGYHRLTLRSGVGRGELEGFLAALADAGRGGASQRVRATPHIGLSSLESEGAAQEERPAAAASIALAAHVPALSGIWSGILGGGSFDLDATEEIVLALSRTVGDNLGAMIPMAALKSHDAYTATHITNVAILAMALGEVLGLPWKVVHDVGVAALLHDVGKLKVPAETLNTPASLTDAQIQSLRRHPEEGARTLLATPGVPELAVIVAFEHHMRFEGGGYPAVPRAWKTNLASAITQVADVYDALRSDRPYRRGLEREKIKLMMMADSGSQFDPELLEAFFDHVVPDTGAG